MGKLKGGPFGGVYGKVGNLVGYMLNGENILRKIGKSSKPLTPARKANCEKMTVVNRFLNTSLRFLNIGFGLAVVGTNRNAYNEAVSYNKMNAVQGEYPNISMDYAKALLSKGSLLKANKPQVAEVEGGVAFSWDTSGIPAEYSNDRVMLLVYFPNTGTSTFNPSGAKRSEGKELLWIGSEMANEPMEAYISFINPFGTEISDSVYVGSLNAADPAVPETDLEQTGIIEEIAPKDKDRPDAVIVQRKSRPKEQVPKTRTQRKLSLFFKGSKQSIAPS